MPKPLKLAPGEIEVFRAGVYPQGTYSLDDVQAIVDSYDAADEHKAWLGLQHVPPGHPEGRSYGVFDSLRRDGSSVIAKFGDGVDPVVKKAFASGEAVSWSAEVYPDYKGTGKPYLKAVKVLGATPPAIKGLKASMFAAAEEDDAAGEAVAIEFSEAKKPAAPRQSIGERIAAAISAALGGDTQFDEEDEDMPKDIAARLDAFEERTTKAEAIAAAANERAEKIEKQFAESQKSTVQREVDSFAEQALKDGKLVKGDDEAGVRQFMAAIDGVTFEVTTTDKDGKTTKVEHDARDFFAELVGRRVTAVPQGRHAADERVRSESGKVTVGKGEGDRVDSDSVKFEEKVQAYMAENPKASPAAAHAAVSAQVGGSRYRTKD